LNKTFNYYKHRISYLTGTCHNFEMEEFFSSFLRRAGMPASAGLSCCYCWRFGLDRSLRRNGLSNRHSPLSFGANRLS